MKRVWRWVRWPLAGVAVLLLAAGGLYWFFLQHFNPDPPANNFPKPATALEAQRQDLAYFRELVALDRSFDPASRKVAQARVSELETSNIALPPQKLHVALMQVMALADNGHTRMRILSDGPKPLMLPVRVTRFADGFYVMRAQAPYRDMLGGRVESIDGVPFEQLLPKLESLRGGIEAFRRDNAAIFIEVQDLLYGLDIARDPKQSAWTVRLPSGRTATHILPASPMRKDDPFPHGTRWLSPEPIKGMGPEWIAYQPATGALPESLRRIDRYFLRFAVHDSCAVYVRVQDIEDTDGQQISPFLSETESEFRAHPPCAVILDLRYNGGGDYTNAYGFAHRLPRLLAPGGRIYVLTDPETFSAAITTTAFVKESGGDKVTILGEPVGDRLAFYAEGGEGCLPNSKFCVDYETGKHDYAHPCRDWNVCYWLNWFFPVRVKTLEPDELVPLRFADWNTGHDEAYDRAVALAGKK